MPQKRAVALSIDVSDVQDAVIAEDIEVETLEEYKTLNEKCDKVIVKIKDRKARKKTKK